MAGSIQAVVNVAEAQIGKPYAYGSKGPNTFDCSGLTYFAYFNGAGINIGSDTTSQFAYPDSVLIINANGNVVNSSSTSILGVGTDPLITNPIAALLPGDLIFWGLPGASGPNAHVQMYVGNNLVIEAPHSNAYVQYSPVTLAVDGLGPDEPLLGVKRYPDVAGTVSNVAVSPDATATTQLAGGDINSTTYANAQAVATSNLPDPRSNLPFCAAFLGMSNPGVTGSSGGQQFKIVGGKNRRKTLSPESALVRGGFCELNTSRPGGPFRAYFMMNPNEIDLSYAFNTSIAPPSTQSPEAQADSTIFVSNQAISFELQFNRMYEVAGLVQAPGPSDIGCRWDVRAFERLMYMYDAQGAATGTSTYASGVYAPQSPVLQVVIGEVNSLRFQARITGFDVTYTIFDVNMIPMECTIALQLLIVYQPTLTADLVQATTQTYPSTGNATGLVGPGYMPTSNPLQRGPGLS